ncbi:MAG: helix-turn-helix domain-containing protein [Proteobacteria bacterium]|nr:helix-turn-helix domain-containing protein [Pseudomonadota bacterium]
MEYSSGDAARILSVSVATVKNYGMALGADIGIVKTANGRWRFSGEHLEVLQRAKVALAQGYTYDDIRQRIANGTLDQVPLPVLVNRDNGGNAGSLMLAVEDLRAELREIKESQQAILAHLEHQGGNGQDTITANRGLLAASTNATDIAIWSLARAKYHRWRARGRGW